MNMDTTLYFLILTTISGVLAVYDEHYCTLTSCGDHPHSGCIYSLNVTGENCGKVLSTGLTVNEIKDIVTAHNNHRQFVASGQETRGPQPSSNNIPNLEWSDELATIAQLWANQCTKGHDKCRDLCNLSNSTVGQNAAGWSSSGPPRRGNVTNMINGWYEEVKYLDKNIVKSFRVVAGPDTGHYTQLVWGKTTHVGCGLSQYQVVDNWTNTTLICNYMPAGNIVTLPVYENVSIPLQ